MQTLTSLGGECMRTLKNSSKKNTTEKAGRKQRNVNNQHNEYGEELTNVNSRQRKQRKTTTSLKKTSTRK